MSLFPEVTQASLTYYLWEGLLVGRVGGEWIQIFAGCGGGSGNKSGRSVDLSANNPYSVGLKTRGAGAGHVHGGPLPTGMYRILKPVRHPRLGPAAELVPQKQQMYGRDAFFFHGRGPHGSDGCIVPRDAKDFNRLYDALTASGGGVLYVAETMGASRFG